MSRVRKAARATQRRAVLDAMAALNSLTIPDRAVVARLLANARTRRLTESNPPDGFVLFFYEDGTDTDLSPDAARWTPVIALQIRYVDPPTDQTR